MPARPRSRIVCAAVLAVLVAGAAADAGSPTGFDQVRAEIRDLRGPSSVAIDGDGRIFIAESRADRVSIFDAGGTRLGTLGRSGHGPGALTRPMGIAVAASGDVFVADADNHRITVFSRDGRHLRQWGERGAEAGRFSFPQGVAVDAHRVYVADTGNGRIQVFDHDGAFRHIMATGIHHDDALFRPIGIAVDGRGNVYVADADRDTIHCFDEARRSTHFGEWGTFPGLLAEPRGLAVRDGRLHAADARNDRVQVFSAPAAPGVASPCFQWGRPAGREDGLRNPIAVAVAPSGEYAVVVEGGPSRARILAAAPARARQTRRPPPQSRFGTLVACDGDLLVLHDTQTETLAVFAWIDDRPARIADLGGRGRETGRLIRPSSVIVDAARGEVLVADAGNARLQLFRVRRDSRAPAQYDPLAGAFVRSVWLPARLGPALRGVVWPPRADDLALLPDGRWLLLDTRNGMILVLDSGLRFIERWGESVFARPTRLAVDAARGRLYVADPGRRRIEVLDLDGVPIDALACDDGDGPFAPAGMAVDAAGVLHVTDAGPGRIVRFDADGRRVAGADLGLRGMGGIALDVRGREIVVDVDRQACLVVDGDGDVRHRIRPWERIPAPPSEIPGRNTLAGQDGWRAMTSNGGSYLVRWRPVPDPVPLNREFSLEVQVLDATSPDGPAPRVNAKVDAAMPHHRHGMLRRPVMRRVPGDILAARGMRLHMPGRWELYVDVARDGVTERAQAVLFVD